MNTVPKSDENLATVIGRRLREERRLPVVSDIYLDNDA